MAKEIVLRIEIGGSLTKVGLVNKDGKIWDKTVFNTEAKKPFPSFRKKLKLEVETLIAQQASTIKILHIAVGAPTEIPSPLRRLK